MLDFRIETFLALCDTMNYTRTAEALSITQPAVTQHIHWLEEHYQCRLFLYSGKTLQLTPKGEKLREYARSMFYNSEKILDVLCGQDDMQPAMRMGATKTIGEFVVAPMLSSFLKGNPKRQVVLTVDNTQKLLAMIERGELDFAMVEGFFDKSKYGSRLFRNESFFGVCAPNHRLADKTVSIEDILKERLILREAGSGTRAIFEQLLKEHNYSFENADLITEISDFSVIKQLVIDSVGIAFLYRPVVERELKNRKLKKLRLLEMEAQREFNYVYLKDSLFLNEWQSFFNVCKSDNLEKYHQ